jgi:uncharacterized protein YjeT (DUF2065 family)
MHDLEQIRANLARWERENAERMRQRPPRRHGRPQTPATRKLLGKIAYERHRAAALADSANLHPLRRARLDRNLTIEALAAKSLVAASLIQKLETMHEAGTPMTWKRLARALNASTASLRP